MLFNGCLSLIFGWLSWKLLVSRLEICLILVLRPVWSPVELFLREVPWVVAVFSEPDKYCQMIHYHKSNIVDQSTFDKLFKNQGQCGIPTVHWRRGSDLDTRRVHSLTGILSKIEFYLSAHFLMWNGHVSLFPFGQRGNEPSAHTSHGSAVPCEHFGLNPWTNVNWLTFSGRIWTIQSTLTAFPCPWGHCFSSLAQILFLT